MRYAVAVTLTKPIPSGSNIVTHLNTYEAVSDAEARGLAFTAASGANPEHEVFSITIVPVETQPEASRSPVSEEGTPETLKPCWTCNGRTFAEITHSSRDERLYRCVNCKAIYPLIALAPSPQPQAPSEERALVEFEQRLANLPNHSSTIQTFEGLDLQGLYIDDIYDKRKPDAPSEERAREMWASMFDAPWLQEAIRVWPLDAIGSMHQKAIAALIRFATNPQPASTPIGPDTDPTAARDKRQSENLNNSV